MKIIEANSSNIEDLASLFDAYRVFYKQESNIEAAKSFLLNRMNQKDSVIYLAYINDKAVGFTQLYPLFSSISMKPIYMLNDLYVDSNYRGKGIGKASIKS